MAAGLDDVRLVAAIDAGLLEPPDSVTESWPDEPPRQPDLARILASWQERDLVPQDVTAEFVERSLRVSRASRDAMRDWRSSPYSGPVDVFGRPPFPALPTTALPTTVPQRTHECGTDGQLADALRELLG
jgi:hypothetical protein